MSEPSPDRPRFAWPAAVAVIAVALFALLAFIIRSCTSQPSQVAQNLAQAAQPQINFSTIVRTSLEALKSESKLVVHSAEVSVMVTKFSEKKVLFGKVNLGRTTVRLRAAGNKAQLVIPLESIREEQFKLVENTELILTIPAPRVDESLVEVQTDPAFYEVETEVGWARLDGFSGEFLREQARRELRPAVIAEAGDPRIIELAKGSAREQLSRVLEGALKSSRPGIKVRIEFDPAL